MRRQAELDLNIPRQGQIRLLSVDLFADCHSERRALRICLDQAPRMLTDTQWAVLLGITKGQLSEYLNEEDADKKKHIPERIRREAQLLANNLAINQWWDLQFRHTPVPMGHTEEVSYLEQQVKALTKKKR